MFEDIELKLSKSHLRTFNCSICNGYLSSSPIRLASDGSNVCGRCSPLDSDMLYPQPTLEAIMSDAKFPCKYRQDGCNMKLEFDHTTEHEENCYFRNPDTLDLSQPGSSTQEENTSQREIKRQTFVLEDAELRVKVDGDNKTFTVKNNGCTVINPFHRSNSNSTSSVVSEHDSWRRRRDSTVSVRSQSRHRDRNTNYDRYNARSYYNGRNYYNERNNYDYNWYHHRRQEYRNRRPWPYRNPKNNLVIIKGHTLHVTL